MLSQLGDLRVCILLCADRQHVPARDRVNVMDLRAYVHTQPRQRKEQLEHTCMESWCIPFTQCTHPPLHALPSPRTPPSRPASTTNTFTSPICIPVSSFSCPLSSLSMLKRPQPAPSLDTRIVLTCHNGGIRFLLLLGVCAPVVAHLCLHFSSVARVGFRVLVSN